MKTKKIVIHRDVNHKKGYLYLPQRNKAIGLGRIVTPIRRFIKHPYNPWDVV